MLLVIVSAKTYNFSTSIPSTFQLTTWTVSEPHQTFRGLEGSSGWLGWELSTGEVYNSTSAVKSISAAMGVSSWVDLLVAYLDTRLATGEGALGISSAMAFSFRLW